MNTEELLSHLLANLLHMSFHENEYESYTERLGNILCTKFNISMQDINWERIDTYIEEDLKFIINMLEENEIKDILKTLSFENGYENTISTAMNKKYKEKLLNKIVKDFDEYGINDIDFNLNEYINQ